MKHSVTTYNTKKLMAESLKRFMIKKPFSKITVSEIINDCGVNRKTFYYHFQDIYELLKWMFEEEAIEIVKHFNLITDYEEALVFVMDYIEENDYIINCAYDSLGRNSMKQFFNADFNEIIFSLITKVEANFNTTLDAEYKKFLCSFYVEALSGALIDWIKNRKNRNREQMTEYLVSTIKGSLTGILKKDF